MQNLYGGMVDFLVRQELALPYDQETYDKSNPRQYVIEKIAKKYGVKEKALKDAYFLDDQQIADKIAEMVVERDKELLRTHSEEARKGWLDRLDGVWSEYLSKSSQMTMTAGLSYRGSKDISADLAKDQFHLLERMINACAEKFVIEMPENLRQAEESKKEEKERQALENAISGKQANGSVTPVRRRIVNVANMTAIPQQEQQKQEASTDEKKDKKQEATVQGEDESKKSKGTNKNQGFGMD